MGVQLHRALLDNQIHVWCCPLTCSMAALPDYSGVLNASEAQRARGFRYERDQQRFILARTGLRLLLGRYLDCSAADIRLDYGSRGKPALSRENSWLNFNLSHSDDLVVYAFTRTLQIGIDIERLRPLVQRESLARRVLSSSELSLLNATMEISRDPLLLSLWSLKEAYAKALGLGLSLPFDSIDLAALSLSPKVTDGSYLGSLDRWHFHQLKVHSEYVGALTVAASDSPRKIQLFHDTLSSLLEPH